MKATVTVTKRGVLTLPAKLRKEFGIEPDDQLIAESTAEGILLRPALTLPVEIYSDARVREFDDEEAALSRVLKKRPKTRR